MRYIMDISYLTVLISILAATLSGFGTAIIAGIRDAKRERNRREEKEKDQLRLDIKDLKIELYQLEKELTEWKDKYYKAIQDLIEMKSELDSVISQLNHLEYHEMLDTE
jgi:septal ring factor EnvC (AmiA/AmiB activator)